MPNPAGNFRVKPNDCAPVLNERDNEQILGIASHFASLLGTCQCRRDACGWRKIRDALDRVFHEKATHQTSHIDLQVTE